MPDSPEKQAPKWHHPSEVMRIHKLKLKKKALQARITGPISNNSLNKTVDGTSAFEDILSAKKRRNPFAKNNLENKRPKQVESLTLDEASDQTLFKLLHHSSTTTTATPITSFENILSKASEPEVVIVKSQGQPHLPIDWTLKSKVRLLSMQPFAWNQKLKISEEASGTTGFVRCLDATSTTKLDTSPNAKFHQCCMYWQQPSLPWLTLFPRTTTRVGDASTNIPITATVRKSLQTVYSDSLRSLFQLIRTKQCPYFYLCSNSFTVLFRAAGLCGISDVHAIITPTTRGFRQMLRQEDVEFTMPLKKRTSDQGYETLDSADTEPLEEEEAPDEEWLKSMGINAEDIKQINYTQAKIVRKSECAVDNSEQSLILVEGVEVHALYNFLINCKSATATTGPLAGIPPTLLAPVAFNGATLQSLKVRESKVHVDDGDYFSIELTGPILPSTVHSLFSINSAEHNMSATFTNIATTLPFSKITRKREEVADDASKGHAIFDKENLSDCGLNAKILGQFCRPDVCVTNVECLKYNCDSKTYTWT